MGKARDKRMVAYKKAETEGWSKEKLADELRVIAQINQGEIGIISRQQRIRDLRSPTTIND